MRNRRFHKSSSQDFSLNQPELSKDIVSELGERVPSITLDKTLAKDMEENLRVNLATSSMNEWLLATIQTILQSSQNQLEKSEQHKNLATNIQTCLDMLDSVGVASAMGIKAAATSLVELTVARKDSILRKIPNCLLEFNVSLSQ